MEEMDTRLYLCSHCCRRCLWHELSPQEHRCMRCRLPHQACSICNRKFEPRDNTEVYCKRCEFHTVKQVSFTPPPVLPLYLDGDMEPQPVEKPQGCTMAQRWRDIKTATGIEDGYFWNDWVRSEKESINLELSLSLNLSCNIRSIGDLKWEMGEGKH